MRVLLLAQMFQAHQVLLVVPHLAHHHHLVHAAVAPHVSHVVLQASVFQHPVLVLH